LPSRFHDVHPNQAKPAALKIEKTMRTERLAAEARPGCTYNQSMPVFHEKQEELEHYETMMGLPRGRLAVTMDVITDAMALVGQHGVYCQSQRWPGKPVLDIQIIMKNLGDAKELIQSVMEELKKAKEPPTTASSSPRSDP
jgi:hypothetical protein